MKKLLAAVLALSLVMFPSLAGATAAQVTSTVATVGLTYSVGESITVTATPTSGVTFSGTTPSTPVISVTTAWQLAAGHTNTTVDFYFSAATAALTAGTSHIPTSAISLKVDSGPFAACNSNPGPNDPVAVAGATCNQGVSLNSAVLANLTGTQTDSVVLEYNGNPALLAAGSYTGTLNIVAASL